MILEATNLSFRRKPNDRAILADIDLKLEAGEFVGLVGANGSGKSTLVRILAGLLKPSQGSVKLSTGAELRRNVGMIFQNPESQLVATVVEEEVAFGPENLGLGGEELRERVDEVLKSVRMEDIRFANPALLSAGQKQRLAIAGVLAARPRFVLLDEPTSFLDPMARRELLEMLARLRSELNLGMLYVTHHLDELDQADRILVLDKGRMVLETSAADKFRKPELLQGLGLDLPYPIQLQRLLNGEGWNLPERGLSEAELLEQLRAGRAAGPILSQCPLSQPNIIEVSGLSRTLINPDSTSQSILWPQSWELQQGACLGIVGPTGSGKSTLMQHMNGLLRPQTGRVTVMGQEIPGRGGDLRELRRQVGLLFQMPERQFFEETVEQEVGFAARNFGQRGDTLSQAVYRSLEGVGLDPELFVGRSPFELSGGERRLVALASVLAAGPQILVLDEPTAGLDAEHRHRVLDFLSGWSGTRLIVSHHLEELALLVDRLLILDKGRLISCGAARGLFGRLSLLGLEPSLVSRLSASLLKDASEDGWPVTLEEFATWWHPAKNQTP